MALRICFVAAETAPFAKAGGLADVAGALGKYLHAGGHDIRLFLPLYRSVRRDYPQLRPVPNLQKLAVQLALDGHLGIVLHPRCLRDRPNKLRLLNLLNYLEEERATTVSLKELALGRIEAAPPSARIGQLRRSLDGERLRGLPGLDET